MNKEQYNSFDNMFREAAMQPGPAVTDAAWQKMEAKLDGQKKKRRVIIFWWLSGLLLGGLIVMMTWINNPSTENRTTNSAGLPSSNQELSPGTNPDQTNTIDAGKQKVAVDQQPGDQDNNKENSIEPVSPVRTPGSTDVAGNRPANSEVSEIKPAVAPANKPNAAATEKPNAAATNKPNAAATNKQAPGLKGAAIVAPLSARKKNVNAVQNTAGKKQNSNNLKAAETNASKSKSPVENEAAVALAEPNIEKENAVVDEKGKTNLPETMADSSAVDTASSQPGKPAQSIKQGDSVIAKKAGKPVVKPSHFYVFATAAPEWSYVKTNGVGDPSVSYGLGFGYSISKKWAIQTGVYLTGKKYLAGKGDYTPKDGSYYDNPYIEIESVDADCKVVEIPLSVRYTFLQKNKLQFFALVGIASAIMKQEDYAYDYTRYGNPAYSNYSYKTGAFHLFSTATLSVGLERRLNKNFSLLFAPYFNIPVQGIGEGKVFINSFGVQGGLKYNLPF